MRVSPIGLLLLALIGSNSAWSNDLPWDTSPSTAWPAGEGQARIELRGDYLQDFGVNVVDGARIRNERLMTPVRVGDGRLWAWVPYGNFEAFNGGRLDIRSDLILRRGDRVADFRDIRLIPSEENKSAQLQILDARGNHLATITHIHALAHPERGELTLHNADIKASDWLASHLGLAELAGMPLGQMWLDLSLDVPSGADLSRTSPDRGTLSCTDRPFWPQDNANRPGGRPEYLVDVRMETLSTVAYQGRQTGTDLIKVAPSATLKSVGFGDAIWVPKFSQLGLYPFQPRDQHPFLVWNMYRISDGRIEQLGASGVKHAFFTININCDINCGSGNVLWPGCEDVYSSGTNDSNSNQGPREDIEAADGLFYSVGSFFDPNSTGSQQVNAGSFQNRLMINEPDLQVPGADYFLDAWYVVMHDIDIWNSMGYHSISPSTFSSGWTFGPLGPFVRDTPLTEWVPFPAVNADEAHVSVTIDGPTPDAVYPANQPSGHFRVLARVEDLGGGEYRYRYAVMNFDFDHGFDAFEIPLPPGAVVSDTFVGGPYDVMTTPWSVDVGPESVRFEAPNGQKLPWFTLYNFEITVDQAPGGQSNVAVVPVNTPGNPLEAHIPETFFVSVPSPASVQNELIFEDRFEQD